MGSSQGPASSQGSHLAPRRSGVLPAAIMMGVPLAAGILVPSFPTVLFKIPTCRGMSAIESNKSKFSCSAKHLALLPASSGQAWLEKRACRRDLLPAWDGSRVELSQAHQLLAGLSALPRQLRRSAIGQRTTAVLDFLCRRGSAAELDDHLRTLADNDALALENSYALTRFITWAIPILGFLGTVRHHRRHFRCDARKAGDRPQFRYGRARSGVRRHGVGSRAHDDCDVYQLHYRASRAKCARSRGRLR